MYKILTEARIQFRAGAGGDITGALQASVNVDALERDVHHQLYKALQPINGPHEEIEADVVADDLLCGFPHGLIGSLALSFV